MTDKFCKDCTYCFVQTGLDGADYSKCYHPAAARKREISLVTGQLEPINPPYASEVRKHECGTEGNLFEERKDKWVMPTAATPPLTEENCYEQGFRYDGISKRFL